MHALSNWQREFFARVFGFQLRFFGIGKGIPEVELAFKHLFRSQQASVPTEHRELRLSLAVLDQLPQSTPKTIVDVLSVHLGRGGITRCRCAAVAFDLDQVIISVIAVFSSMAAGGGLAAAIAALIVQAPID